jgi:hypothetical protein
MAFRSTYLALESRSMTGELNEHPELFADEVRRAFAFLEGQGFSYAVSSPSRVRYESGSVYLDVQFSARDGEVAISFGRLRKKEEFSFTLDCLAKLAVALTEEGRPILAGDEELYERMKRVRWWDFRPDALKGRGATS